MSREEQLQRDIEDYSKNPYNKYIVSRAKEELAELRKKQIVDKVEEVVSKTKLKSNKK